MIFHMGEMKSRVQTQCITAADELPLRCDAAECIGSGHETRKVKSCFNRFLQKGYFLLPIKEKMHSSSCRNLIIALCISYLSVKHCIL